MWDRQLFTQSTAIYNSVKITTILYNHILRRGHVKAQVRNYHDKTVDLCFNLIM